MQTDERCKPWLDDGAAESGCAAVCHSFIKGPFSLQFVLSHSSYRIFNNYHILTTFIFVANFLNLKDIFLLSEHLDNLKTNKQNLGLY